MRRFLLGLHVALLALALAYYATAVTVFDTPDANIGAGLAVAAIGLMGLPWSWIAFDPTRSTWDDMQVPFTLAALLNLGLHWSVGAWWLARKRRRV